MNAHSAVVARHARGVEWKTRCLLNEGSGTAVHLFDVRRRRGGGGRRGVGGGQLGAARGGHTRIVEWFGVAALVVLVTLVALVMAIVVCPARRQQCGERRAGRPRRHGGGGRRVLPVLRPAHAQRDKHHRARHDRNEQHGAHDNAAHLLRFERGLRLDVDVRRVELGRRACCCNEQHEHNMQ